MAVATIGPLSGRALGIIDLHTHPSLKMMLFNARLWGKHVKPSGFFEWTLRTDLDSLIAGGVKAVTCTAYVLERGWAADVWPIRYAAKFFPPLRRMFTLPEDQLGFMFLDRAEAAIEETRKRRGDVIELARSYTDFHRIMDAGKVAVLHALEGAHHLNGDLANLDRYFERGVYAIVVPHMYPNHAGQCVNAIPRDQILRKVGCFKEPFDINAGITDWGRQLVDRMFELGVVVDVTHGTIPFRNEVFEMARKHPKQRPVIFSHAGLRRFCDELANVGDDEIRAIAETGGVVGLLSCNDLLKAPKQKDGLDVVMASVEHLVNTGGEDVVAFGSDFDGFTTVPRDWRSPRDYNGVRDALLKKYTTAQVEKFLSGNADRVLRTGWGKA
jgi:membrane dipeptidase